MRGSNTNTSELCFPLLLKPQSVFGHSVSPGAARTERGGCAGIYVSGDALSGVLPENKGRTIKVRRGTEGAVDPGPTPLPSFREREKERESDRGPVARDSFCSISVRAPF